MSGYLPDHDLPDSLQLRVDRVHLRQRLGIEQAKEKRIFGQGLTFFHIENLRAVRTLLRTALQLSLLHGRSRRNARRIVVRENDLLLRGLPAGFDGYTILQVSDLHLDMADDFPHVLVGALRGVSHDLCVLTGDYRAETWGDIAPALAAMRQVRSQLGGEVYAVLGNHDSIRMVPELEGMGIRVLLNEAVAVERNGECLYLAGVDDAHYFRADNIEKAAAGIPDDAVSILLSHSPEIYCQAAHADFSVMFSGHTHGGQICLPGGIAIIRNASCPRRYCRGAWRYHEMQGYTSSGSGACVVDVRLNCPPEITLHHLHCA